LQTATAAATHISGGIESPFFSLFFSPLPLLHPERISLSHVHNSLEDSTL